GKKLDVDFAPELGLNVYSVFIDIPAGSTRTVELRLNGRLSNITRYTLDVFHQPMITPDAFEVAVNGAGPVGKFSASRPLLSDVRLDLRVAD
ncbi:MAG: hypothetical protein Q8K63_08335, partial [Acidimicrobiales bacterium]|nr:hypothetical protein [Acidimicrobiales bacterium]